MRTTFIAFTLILTTPALSQNQVTDTSATCVAYWAKGETKVYTITRTREKKQASGASTTVTLSFEAHLKVVDSTAEGYTIEWRQKNYSVGGDDKVTSEVASDYMQGLAILYKTTDAGAFKELVNWKEVRDFYVNLMTPIVSTADKDAVAAINQAKSMFQTKENVEAALIREIQIFHMPYGMEYSKSGEHTTSLLPNIGGGEPFPATVSLTLTRLMPDQDRCRITVNQRLDKKAGRVLLIDMLKKLVPKEDVQGEIEKAIQNVELTDITDYDLALSTGWLRQVSLHRVVNIGVSSQVERYVVAEKK